VEALEKETARILLASLLGRIEPDSATGKYQIRGVISDHELAAMKLALDQLGGPLVETEEVAAVPIHQVKLTSPALLLKAPEDPEVTLCLDFGTAMSKGFAIREKSGKLSFVPLRLGQRAGEPEAIHPVSSSIWIDGLGRAFLGTEAVTRGQPSGNRRREDSLKRFLTLPNAGGDLDAKELDPAVNATEIVFTEEDALTLYLAYLTDLAASALEDEGISRYVRRRFAIPCWDKERRTWGEKLLSALLVRAAIVADQFHGKWGEGIPLAEAKAVIETVKRVSDLPTFLVADGISEPVAAGSSFLELQEHDERKLMMVVDVGAGTSDFALFVVAKPSSGSSRYAFNLIPGSARALPQAGDRLDSVLLDAILAKVGVRPSSTEYAQVRNDLQHRIRGLKERLCRDGSITAAASNGSPFTVTRDDFLKLPEVQKFGQLLQLTFEEVVKSVDPSHFTHLDLGQPVEILLTGGGSGLDMVKQLATGQVCVKDKIVQRQQANELPEDLRRESRAVRDDYPQLAVAIGGALPTPLLENDAAISPGFTRVELGGFYQKGA
jgi:molecular chaperone HscA